MTVTPQSSSLTACHRQYYYCCLLISALLCEICLSFTYHSYSNLISSFLLIEHKQRESPGRYLLKLTMGIRSAEDIDVEAIIRPTMIAEKMNPLFLKAENFLVVEDDSSGEMEGFGQIRPVPFSSSDFELASVYILRNARRQKKGSQMAKSLIQRYLESTSEKTDRTLYVLTLGRTAPFFEKLGFREVSQTEAPNIPWPLKAEIAVGQIISKLVKGNVVCLTYDESEGHRNTY
mmetsp:Transcript_17401/g.22585  ORF Transcript_17401/g.22585 Transcript_17401/m.22585 type:complete len:233 (-) Transcript_17401:116-814(-)